MHELVFGTAFLKSAKKLDTKLKSELKINLDMLSAEPFQPTLHTKPLTGKLSGYHSLRLGRDYRIIFKFTSNSTIHLIMVGHRKDIYKT